MKRDFDDGEAAPIRNRASGFTDQELESRFSSQSEGAEGAEQLMDEATIRKMMREERSASQGSPAAEKKSSRWENRRASVDDEPEPSIAPKSPSPPAAESSSPPPKKKSRWENRRAEVAAAFPSEDEPSIAPKSPSPPPKRSRWENRRAQVDEDGGVAGGDPASSGSAEASARASAGAAASMSPGDMVVLHSLKAAASLNGEKARLVRLDESTGRWEVRLLKSRESKAIKPANLQVTDSDDEDEGAEENPSWAPKSPEQASDPPVAPPSPPAQVLPSPMSGRAGGGIGMPNVAQRFDALPRVSSKPSRPARQMGTIRWYNGRRKLGVIIPDSGGADLFIPAQGASNGSQVPPQPGGLMHGTRVSYVPTAIKSESSSGSSALSGDKKQIVCMDVRALAGQTGLSVGVETFVGGKEKNDDRLAATDLHELGFLAGIFDGHLGSTCADFVAKQVPPNILSSYRARVKKDGGPGGMIKISHSQEVKIIEKAFVDAFEEVDKAYLITARKKEMKDGSTGLVALVSHGYEVPVAPTTAASLWPPERNAAQKQPGTVGRAPGGVAKLFLAWCGDSRCVLLRGRQGLRVTEDHRPNRRDEQSRIKAAGGKIAQDSHGIWRVGPREENRYAKELEKNKKKNSAHMKMYLSTSRSFGDIGLKAPDPIVTATPDVKVVDLTPDDWAVMMGCDGIFDVLSDQEVANVLFKAMVSDGLDPVGAAKAVVQAAFKSGSRDNLTAIVMRLGWSLPPTSTTETPSYLPAAVAEAAAATAEVKKDEFDMFG